MEGLCADITWTWNGISGFRRYFCRPPLTRSSLTPSFSIPDRRHFLNRQAWQAFLRRLFISHSPLAGQVYSILPDSKDKNYLLNSNTYNHLLYLEDVRNSKLLKGTSETRTHHVMDRQNQKSHFWDTSRS